MTLFQSLLNRMFSLMAFAGLLLASWGLVVTPEEIHSTGTESEITLSGHWNRPVETTHTGSKWAAKWGEKLGAKWSMQLAAVETPLQALVPSARVADSGIQTFWSP